MRVLFTFVGGNGHFVPLVPIARAALAAGHLVAFAGHHSMIAMVEAAGFTMFPTGTPDPGPPERLPLQPVDMQREFEVLRDGFAGRAARNRAADVFALCEKWHPDLIVCDEIDFGAMLAAERASLPYASVLVIAAGSFVRHDVVATRLNEVRAEYGLPPDPDLTMLSRYLVLSPFPARYRDPAFPLPRTAHMFRPLTHAASHSAALLWQRNEIPTVYFSLGTVFNSESGDLFARVLAGLRELPINVIATVGNEIDPAEFGAQPANIRIERYIAQAAILPQCDLVVSHGGSGSVIGALAYGLPMVLIPMGADQPLNGERCAALGIARVLDPVAATPADVRDAVTTILGDARYRQSAESMRDAIAAMPEPSEALALLEQLAAQRQPVYAA